MSNNNNNKDDFTLIVMPGSPFVQKVMVALESRNIKPYLHWVNLPFIKDQLPSPSKVPVLIRNKDIINDSQEIFNYLENNVFDENNSLFNKKYYNEIKELNTEIFDDFNVFFFYYVFVDEKSWNTGFKNILDKQIPWFLKILGFTPDFAISEQKIKFKNNINKIKDKYNINDINNSNEIDNAFNKFLNKLENKLKNSNSNFLFNDQKIPTAADCSLYGMLERLCGTSGDANFYTALPDLLNNYPELNKFLKFMEKEYPIIYKGRRRPKNLDKLPIPTLYKKNALLPPQVRSYLLSFIPFYKPN